LHDSIVFVNMLDELGRDFYIVYLDGIVGDGMVNSNLTDLFKWDRALTTQKLIDDGDKKYLFNSYKTNDGEDTDYGFGWMIDNSKSYGKIINHSGGWGGYVIWNEIHLDNQKTIVILQNISNDETTIPIKNTQQDGFRVLLRIYA